MRSRIHLVKNGLAAGIAVGLAVLSGAHALSSASVRTSPEFSVAVWPSNGLALERLAYRAFAEDIRKALGFGEAGGAQPSGPEPDRTDEMAVDSDQLRRSAGAAFPAAARALSYDPLLPKVHAIFALSESDPVRRERIVALASQLNRRDLSLQGLVLQSKVDAGDYPGAIETLDQILRVHPQRQAEFFPALTEGLRNKVTTPAYRDLLAKPLPWRDSFLMHAVGDAVAARNLAIIRQTVDFDNPDFDRKLIANLVRNGDLQLAARIYRQLGNSTSLTAESAWSSVYPPFEWTFADKAGLRAQLSNDGSKLEFTIDPGTGGVLASRLMASPDAPFTISVRYQLANPSLGKDLKLSLTCLGQAEPFLESAISDKKGRFDVLRDPGCGYIDLKLMGRSWTGGEPLNGSITEVVIAAR